MKKIYFLLAIVVSTLTFAASTYLLAPGGTVSINEFGICKTLNNSSTKTFIVPTGISSDWNAFLSNAPAGVSISTCTNNCIGSWGACTGGVQTYTISQAAFGGGAACPYANGATQSCPVDCVGSWSACSSGTQTYTVTTPASGGGASCPSVNGAIATCGVNCVGSWGACNSGSQVFTVTTPASGGGTNCPVANNTSRACGGTDCVGSWGACSKPCLGGVQTYTVTAPATGAGANCPNVTGDTQDCNVGACGTRVYSECFVEGTLVKLANGEDKRIEEIEIGDVVRSYDERLGKLIDTPVIESLKHKEKLNELYSFELSNGIEVTSNAIHPYFVENLQDYLSAETIYKMWKEKKEIKFLTDARIVVTLKSVKLKKSLSRLYNLHVLSPYDLNYYKRSMYGHNYFANGILVHNNKCVGSETVMEFSLNQQCCSSVGGVSKDVSTSSNYAKSECTFLQSKSAELNSCFMMSHDNAQAYAGGTYECYAN